MLLVFFTWFLSTAAHFDRDDTSASNYVIPVDCVNEGFDFVSYFQTQRRLNDNQPHVKVMYMRGLYQGSGVNNKWMDKYIENPYFRRIIGVGHTFIQIGEHYGQNCLKHYAYDPTVLDTAGCQPFSNVISKFQGFQQCLEENSDSLGIPSGAWLSSPYNIDIFEYYEMYTVEERILYRLSMLADSEYENSTIPFEKNVETLFSEAELKQQRQSVIHQCMKRQRIGQDQFKCYSVLKGSPGFNEVSLMDHSADRPHAQRRTSHECGTIPSFCGRLALQKLHHFQVMPFNSLLLLGVLKTRYTKNPKQWQWDEQKQWVHEQCQKPPRLLGKTICWNFSKCFIEMLKKVCQEHEACCPDEQTQLICRDDLRHPGCTICPKDYQ